VALGYHRAARLSGESEQRKRRITLLFWVAYALDKGLSLRLERSFILQDYDITLPRTLERFEEFDEHRQVMQNWVNHAQIQGRIYEELHSPAALLRPAEQRMSSAVAYIGVLRVKRDQLVQTREKLEQQHAGVNASSVEIASMLWRSDEVATLSTLTLVYRTMPPNSASNSLHPATIFCRECIQVAREAIQAHLGCTKQVGANPQLATVYLHWYERPHSP
jgi:hypothetical protein